MGATNFPIFIDWKQKVDLSQFTNLEKQVDKFGMRIRLSSRDALRMGSVLDRAATTGTSMFEKLLAGSMDWQAASQDIDLAWGDIGAVIGDTIAPLLEGIIPILEQVASFLEANPWAVWVALIPLILSLLMKVGAEFFKIYGSANMFVGMLVTAKGNMLSISQSAHYMAIWTAQGEEAAAAYLVDLGKIRDLTVAEQKKDKKGRFTKGKKNVPAAQIKEVGTEATKTDTKLKKLSGTVGMVAGAIGGLGIMSILLSGSNDILNEGMQTLSDLCEPLTEALGGIVGFFMDWAETNPGIAEALILIGGSLAVLVGFGPKILGIIDLFSGLASAGLKAFGAIAGKLGAEAFGKAITQMGADIGKVGLVEWFKTIGGKAKEGILEQLGLGAKGAGLNFKALAIDVAAAAGGFTIGFYAASALKKALGPLGPLLVVLIGGFIALAAAVAMAYTEISWGIAAPVLIAGAAAAVGGVLSASGILDSYMPGLAGGGLIKTAGVAMLHPDEAVLPKDTFTVGGNSSLIQPIRREEQVPTSITIHINAPIGSKEIADYVTDSVTKSIESKLKRTR